MPAPPIGPPRFGDLQPPASDPDPTLTLWVEIDPSDLRLAIACTRTVAREYRATAPEWETCHRATAARLEIALRAAMGAKA